METGGRHPTEDEDIQGVVGSQGVACFQGTTNTGLHFQLNHPSSAIIVGDLATLQGTAGFKRVHSKTNIQMEVRNMPIRLNSLRLI